MAYTSETRGSLKKLLPTCTQPTAKELAAEDAFQKKQQENYAAAVAKANPQPSATAGGGRPQGNGRERERAQVAPPKNAEERAIRRCVSSGRLPATCTGNSLLGAFGQMLSSVLPVGGEGACAGTGYGGSLRGSGGWRLDFIDGGVLVNCSFLSPNQEMYTIDFKRAGRRSRSARGRSRWF